MNTLIVDKTGTLTEGRPKLMAVIPGPDLGESTALRLAASLEQGSEHPLAAAIVSGATERGLTLSRPGDFEAISGKGVIGTVDGCKVALGNQALFEQLQIDPGPLAEKADELRAEAQTVMFVAVDQRAAGLLAVADPIKATTAEAIRQLHDEGVKIVMLTGDNRRTADAVARQLRIDEVVADVWPCS